MYSLFRGRFVRLPTPWLSKIMVEEFYLPMEITQRGSGIWSYTYSNNKHNRAALIPKVKSENTLHIEFKVYQIFPFTVVSNKHLQ